MAKFIYVLISLCIIQITKSSDSYHGSVDTKGKRSIYDVEHDPDEDLTTPQIIKRHGYAAESHFVQTEDGYILTLDRIPANRRGVKGKQPIFIQHGLLSSSADWVDIYNISLAFLLSDSGYDVWLGNARGNDYSKAHVNLSISSAQFWNFSFHEMGIYDVPASLNYVAAITGKSGEIIYIGHSMGSTMFFVFASLLPEVAKTVKLMVGLAPAVYMTHIRSPVRYLCPWVGDLEWIAKHLGFNEFSPSEKVIKFLAYECYMAGCEKKICESIIFAIGGFDKAQVDDKTLFLILSHAPASTSTKTIIHYAQEIKNYGIFQEYDYGPDSNLKKYGTLYPPAYNLSNVNVPTYLMYGDGDTLASPIDVKRLAQNLTNNKGVYRVQLESFNHIDFLYGKDARKLVYLPLLDVIKPYS